MKNKAFLTITILLLSIVISCFAYKVNATGLGELQNPDLYIKQDGDNSNAIGIGNVVVWIVRTAGEAISVIILLVIGIKYILGSVEEKAEYKQSMWPYIIGAVLLFGGSALVDVIYKSFIK